MLSVCHVGVGPHGSTHALRSLARRRHARCRGALLPQHAAARSLPPPLPTRRGAYGSSADTGDATPFFMPPRFPVAAPPTQCCQGASLGARAPLPAKCAVKASLRPSERHAQTPRAGLDRDCRVHLPHPCGCRPPMAARSELRPPRFPRATLPQESPGF